jgi:deoxycytidylate deaminase
MTDPALKLHANEDIERKISKKIEENSLKRIQDTLTEELVIGLCGPVGTDIHNVSKKIKSLLENEYDYKVVEIRLSRIIEMNTEQSFFPEPNKHSKEYCRIKDLILRGDKLRENNSPRILAECAIKRIGIERDQQKEIFERTHNPDDKVRRICYVIDSIKNKSEYDLFKSVYRDLFYFYGIFSPKEYRVSRLKERGLEENEIFDLIDQDSGEETDYGQSVANTFILADFFIRNDDNVRKTLEAKIKRYFHLIFDTDIITPYPDETAMYLASSASVNSGCLSRQVGAAVTDPNGEVLCVGWNDVPKFGGGVYKSVKNHPDDNNDHRCKCLDPKECFNTKNKKEILTEINNEVNALFIEYERDIEIILHRELKKLLTPDILNKMKTQLAEKDYANRLEAKINDSNIKNLIEFSRSIHAEMHAIIKGAQNSADKMVGGKLYCTTFPCHNCARHIVMAGIHEVYYIEPYTKSRAEKLHSDSLTTYDSAQNKVKIRMYDGVSPNRYIDLFKITSDNRKNDMAKPGIAKPKYQLTLEDLKALESLTAKLLPDSFKYVEI